MFQIIYDSLVVFISYSPAYLIIMLICLFLGKAFR